MDCRPEITKKIHKRSIPFENGTVLYSRDELIICPNRFGVICQTSLEIIVLIVITAVVCTYNRADLLAGAIESLCSQQMQPSEFEILIIDNASTDNTQEVIKKYQMDFSNHVIRCVVESKIGLGFARNRALAEARGEYIAYMDDDARAEPDWLERALALLQGDDQPLCVGGKAKPYYASPKPEWFKDQYEIHSWGDQERLLQYGESFSGLNMIWIRDQLIQLGGFQEDVGVSGEKLSVGEETSVFARAWRTMAFPCFRYDPNLVVNHWIPQGKMRTGYYLQRAWATGQAEYKMHQPVKARWRLRTLIRSGAACMLWALRAIWRRPGYPRGENWLVEEWQPVFKKAGLFAACLGIQKEVLQVRS